MSDYFYSLGTILWEYAEFLMREDTDTGVRMCGIIADLATEANQ
jgi:hypothetical protein